MIVIATIGNTKLRKIPCTSKHFCFRLALFNTLHTIIFSLHKYNIQPTKDVKITNPKPIAYA